MTVRLNHTIVSARDKKKSAIFFAEILGLPLPFMLGHFAVVQIGETSLDFVSTDDATASRHFAFLVSEAEFDEIFARIRERGMSYWADPFHNEPNRINNWDDGRGVYFEDPDGHNLEILTRPYGSGGTKADHPNPLVARPIAPDDGKNDR
jgi:catechol 2,3-dioxygenase-like lactoylglutathione lyase family enzyme